MSPTKDTVQFFLNHFDGYYENLIFFCDILPIICGVFSVNKNLALGHRGHVTV